MELRTLERLNRYEQVLRARWTWKSNENEEPESGKEKNRKQQIPSTPTGPLAWILAVLIPTSAPVGDIN